VSVKLLKHRRIMASFSIAGEFTAILSNRVDSWHWPAETSITRGRALPSVIMRSFVPRPPRERPNA
jgi:hypothetical protein